MRISEKSIELNFCSETSTFYGGKPIWIGLTQKQEAQLGWDACSVLPGQLLFFQFKASNLVLKNGDRRFHAQHHQLTALKSYPSIIQQSTYYVLPNIGTYNELVSHRPLANYCFYFDLYNIPLIPPPVVMHGHRLRKSAIHYFDLTPPSYTLTIRSEPVVVQGATISTFMQKEIDRPRSNFHLNWSFEEFWSYREKLSRFSVAAFIPT